MTYFALKPARPMTPDLISYNHILVVPDQDEFLFSVQDHTKNSYNYILKNLYLSSEYEKKNVFSICKYQIGIRKNLCEFEIKTCVCEITFWVLNYTNYSVFPSHSIISIRKYLFGLNQKFEPLEMILFSQIKFVIWEISDHLSIYPKPSLLNSTS